MPISTADRKIRVKIFTFIDWQKENFFLKVFGFTKHDHLLTIEVKDGAVEVFTLDRSTGVSRSCFDTEIPIRYQNEPITLDAIRELTAPAVDWSAATCRISKREAAAA
jgi:hypothetical protein